MKQLEVGTLLKAMRLRARGMTWGTIARETGVKQHRIRNAVDPNFRVSRKLQQQRARPAGYRSPCVATPIALVPWDVFAEAQQAYSAPRTLTAILMGDPPAGRSALDKR
jgi:hypothetical protein